MAVTSAQIVDFLLANPGMTDAQIVTAMDQYGISPSQMASAVGLKEGEVVSRIVPVLAQDVAQNGLYTQTIANNETGQTEITQRTLPLGFNAYQDESGQLSYSRVDSANPNMIQLYGSQGEYRGQEKVTTSTQDLIRNLGPIALAAGGSALLQGLLGGAAAAGTAGTVGTTGLTMAELAQLDLALGGAGGTLGAETLAAALTTGAAVPTLTNLTGGSGVLTGTAAGITAESVAAKLAADAATQFELLNAGAGAFTPTTLPPVTTPGLLTPPVVPPTGVPPLVPPVVPPTGLPPVVPPVFPTTGVPPVIPTSIPPVADLIKAGLTTAQIANLFSTGTQTAAGLLQQQTSKEAAVKAQAMIDRETAAAKAAAQFRPIGMTTRFGASQFGFDPVTGQLTSAGYTLSPEAKNAQDRFVRLAESGIQQAEGAQQAFAPLQTGAQSLFKLGQGYLAQNPEDVAKNYLASQMALLQPGRETELANLQNRLQQQGRGGLSVAQGGALGATTPELQALYNARAQQEAQLAANAQQYGQQNVAFGAGLLGTGAQTMGQYYGGQQAAYAPYTTALGQVQGLETAAQQPLMLGAQLGQQAAQAGANVGRLGLSGAEFSTRLATGNAATTNPYSTLLSGLGASPAFGQAIGGLFS